MDTKIKVPQALKAKVMLWTDVSYHDMEELDNIESIPDLESALCSVLAVDLPEPKRGVLLELYVHTVLFCREHSFKKEQTSALLSIMKSVHEANTETPFNIEHCSRYCNELLLCHSVRRPPFSINLFTSEEVKYILQYIQSNYLTHYKLYKYIFTPQLKLDLSLTYSDKQDEPNVEESSASDIPEASLTERREATRGSKSELQTLIETEVREQMMLVSGQLDQRLKEIADQHNSVRNSPQLNHKGKK